MSVEDSVKLLASLDPQLACISAQAWGKLDSVSIYGRINHSIASYLFVFRWGSCVKGAWWRVRR